MFAQVRIGLVAVALVGMLAGTSLAGPIAAGSSPDGPSVLGTIYPGAPVGNQNVIINQYQHVGLNASVFQDVSLAALGSIGGTTAFIPAAATAKGFTVDYSSFVGFQIVNPTDGMFATTNSVSVEFIGPRADQGFLYALTPEGGILGSTMADDGIGPNGGFLATLNLNGIGIFAAWSLFDPSSLPIITTATAADPTWGLASITIGGNTTEPPPGGGPQTPEPATLALALGGLFGAAGAGWKRRQANRS